MKKSVLSNSFKKVRDMLKSQLRHNLAEENWPRSLDTLNLIQDLEGIIGRIEPYCIDWGKGPEDLPEA